MTSGLKYRPIVSSPSSSSISTQSVQSTQPLLKHSNEWDRCSTTPTSWEEEGQEEEEVEYRDQSPFQDELDGSYDFMEISPPVDNFYMVILKKRHCIMSFSSSFFFWGLSYYSCWRKSF